MYLPYVNNTSKSRTYQTAFLGYNHTENCSEGEFYDMKNMSSDQYPVLAQRQKRGIYKYPEGDGKYKAKAIIGKDALCFVSEGKFYINNHPVNGLEVETKYDKNGKEIPIQLISMGAYVVIFPQRKWVNTLVEEQVGSTGEVKAQYGNLDNLFPIGNTESSQLQVKYTLAKADGTSFTEYGKELPVVAPEEPVNGDVYLDKSVTPNVVKIYSDATKSWSSVPTTYVKIECDGIGEGFSKGDGVTISGINNEIVKGLNGSHVLFDVGENHVTVIGIISETVTTSGIKVERKAPDMDFVIESQNRLWGCKYGDTEDGDVVNAIYASKLGDFKNWNVFSGIASDSYALPVGSDGAFTGAITYQGMPLFFKENCLHVMYGNAPSNYQIQTTICEGVHRGSWRSLAIAENLLLYKGVNGIYGFDGSLPVLLSSAFGPVMYDDAVAGTYANKYYVSMKNRYTKSPSLFVFDTQKNIWHKEDETAVSAFCKNGDELYFITESDDLIHTVRGSGELDGAKLEWMAETGVIGKNTPDKKYLSKIAARIKLTAGARIKVYAQYDSVGEWVLLSSMDGRTMQSVVIPVRMHRHDHVRLRFVGVGEAYIYSIAKTLQTGGDR